MSRKRSRDSASKKKNIDVDDLLNKVQKRNLEKIRQENIKSRNKRKRTISETSIDEIIKKVTDEVDEHSSETEDESGVKDYLKWKQSEYDTYNSVSRSSVLDSIDILEKLLKKKKKKKKDGMCFTTAPAKGSNKISLWSSATYLMKYIRSCIIHHDWKSLNHLLLFLLNHNKYYTCYIKEITFLTSLMLSKQDSNIIPNLKQCFLKHDKKYDNMYDIWFVNDK